MKLTIKIDDIKKFNIEKFGTNILAEFPKYTSQIINLANQNAQGTRPKVVGQLSELFPASNSRSVDEWREWYTTNYPDAIDEATEKIYRQILNMKSAIPLIDKELVKKWVEDLVINKTFYGLYVQDVILSAISNKIGKSYRRASPDEESKGIDGYVGDKAYSIKPYSYKCKNMIHDRIDVIIIYYTKTKNELVIEFDE